MEIARHCAFPFASRRRQTFASNPPQYQRLPPTVRLFFPPKQLRIKDLRSQQFRGKADELWRASIRQKTHKGRRPKLAKVFNVWLAPRITAPNVHLHAPW